MLVYAALTGRKVALIFAFLCLVYFAIGLITMLFLPALLSESMVVFANSVLTGLKVVVLSAFPCRVSFPTCLIIMLYLLALLSE